MRKDSHSAIIYVTKVEAARRQVNAAIRMSFLNEDKLAIHTVVAAAYRVLRDLLEKRGVDDLADVIRAGLFYTAKDLVSGTLSENKLKILAADEYLKGVVAATAERIRQHGNEADIDAILPRSAMRISNEKRRSHFENLCKSANFLKHADRDHLAAIALDDIDNDILIISASAAYTMLSHDLTAEMAVFYALTCVTKPEQFEATDALLAQMAKALSPLSASRRRRACLRMLKNWNKVFNGA
jgi:hypothetical protein